MDTARLLANLGEFIGAIVIVATLIYPVMQVKQNTNALHAQSRQAVPPAASGVPPALSIAAWAHHVVDRLADRLT